MKDGVNSANRYYLNRFRDAYRQAVIGMEKQTDICCINAQVPSLTDSSESFSFTYRPNDGLASNRRPLLHLQ